MTIRIVEWAYYSKIKDLIVHLNIQDLDIARQKAIYLFELMHKDADVQCYGEVCETGYCLEMSAQNRKIREVWDVIKL